MTKSAESAIYGNCGAVDDNGRLMFRCDLRKMKWYLRKGLAELVTHDPPRIKLLFEPRGNGHDGDLFFVQARRNICVVCGTDANLTRHHVLPHCYRRWFPRSLDAFGTYDVMAICSGDHEQYEQYSASLREDIAREYRAPLDGIGGRSCPATNKATKSAYAIMRHGDNIPRQRLLALKKHVVEFFDVEAPTSDTLKRISEENRGPYKTHAQIVVEKIGDDFEQLGGFIVRWRSHFVETMQPRHLPDHWDVNRIFMPK